MSTMQLLPVFNRLGDGLSSYLLYLSQLKFDSFLCVRFQSAYGFNGLLDHLARSPVHCTPSN